MGKQLVIVESPTKAKTLKKFLGPDFIVESSVGHVRDLPASAAEIPANLKKEKWARLGVNVEDDFKPLYIVHPDKKKKIAELKKLAKEVERILLATDEDREGEAISWHLLELLKPKVPVARMVFHEITKTAIQSSIEQTREIDQNLVNAQEARRIIDRLYGYEISPVLWRKIAPRLSAGRVQSVAIRMLVHRERERMRFHAAHYWDLIAEFVTAEEKSFPARLQTVDGKRLASGKDFDPDTGLLRKNDVVHLDEAEAKGLLEGMKQAVFKILSAEEKPFTRSPAAPFTTSTLQQEGNRKLRFDARRTMRAAQRLYENGYITYMRTDSVALSSEGVRGARGEAEKLYGRDYLPDSPRAYRNKVKNAQEAHEAIRPAGEQFAPLSEIQKKLGPDESKVYEMIWKRTLASQMKDAHGRRMVLKVVGESDGREVVFQATGSVIDFPGFLRAYVEGRDDPEAALGEKETLLPPVREGDTVRADKLDAEGHVTQPPARLTEASLVKALEESGIGRPSTYASIIDTIQRREYTFKKGTALVPTFTAFAVVNLMEVHLAELIDFAFTAKMEDRLDSIARGEFERSPYLREFYFGNGKPGLRKMLDQQADEIDPREINAIPLAVDGEGRKIVARVGRFGPFLQREDDTAPIPEGSCPDELTIERCQELLAAGAQAQEPVGEHEGKPVYVKTGRFGPYVQHGDADPDNKKEKPKMVSLLPGMSPETLTMDQAKELLSLPRALGDDEQGNPVIAHFGRYGAYIKRGTDTRSLGPDDNILTIELPRALELLAQEKKRSFRNTPKELKVFEKVEALDGIDVKLLAGRYGPYLTDGDVNASLPKDFGDHEQLTLEQAVEFILVQRSKPRRKKKVAKKKAAKKKTTTKKKVTKKKATAKKTAGKESSVKKTT